MRRIPSLLGVLFVAALAGCGGTNNGEGGSDTSASTLSTESTASTPAPAKGGPGSKGGGSKELEIKIQNFAFSPANATVKVGTKIKWTNEDDAPHNATGGELKSKTVGKGGTFTYTADKPEKIDYICTVHPNMKATLTVTK